MTIRRYFLVSWTMTLIASALLPLAAGTLDRLYWLPGVGLVSWMFLSANQLWHLARQPRLIPAIYLLLGAILGWFRYRESGDVIYFFSYALFALFPIFTRKIASARGHWQVLTVSVVFGLANLLASDGAYVYGAFILLCLSLLTTLNAGHLFFHIGAAEATRVRVPDRYFWSFVGSAGSGLLLGVLLFVFFPRTWQWTNPLALRSRDSETGYSGNLSLGPSSIQESTRLALIIESADPGWLQQVAPTLLVRGNRLIHFDGTRWDNGTSDYRPFTSSRSIQDTSAVEDRSIHLKIFRAESQAPAILFPGLLREIQLPRHLMGRVRFDSNGTIERVESVSEKYNYEVVISPLRKAWEIEKTLVKDYPQLLLEVQRRRLRRSGRQFAKQWDWAAFLQIPEEVKAKPYWTRWKDRFTATAESTFTVGQAAAILQTHFQNGYETGYQGAEHGVSDLEGFFKRRYGHCEFFATASVLWFRSLGIPARMVLGYRGGTYNPVAQVLEIRDSNAHAWMEIFSPDVGWIALDPTPTVPRFFVAGVFDQVAFYASAFKFWFEKYVVDYNIQTQRQFFQDLGALQKHVPERGDVSWEEWGTLGSMTLMIAVLVFLFVWVRGRLASDIPTYFRVLERQLRRGGLERAPNQTFRSYLEFSIPALGTTEMAKRFQIAVERDLYSRNPTSHQERSELVAIARKTGIKKTAGPHR